MYDFLLSLFSVYNMNWSEVCITIADNVYEKSEYTLKYWTAE